MRFSYIDSQGKEIEVDSVESLALRIELGAIKSDTRMYDAVADRWAPAEEHPVFRSLSRGEEVTEADVVHIGQEEPEGGPAPPDAGEAEPDAEPAEAEASAEAIDEAGEAEEEAEVETSEEAGAEAEPAAGSGDAGSDDELGLDFQVTLSEDEAEPDEPEPVADELVAEDAAADRPAAAGEVPAAEAEGGDDAEEAEDDVFGGFDGLELEEAEEAGGDEPPPDDVPEAGETPAAGEEPTPLESGSGAPGAPAAGSADAEPPPFETTDAEDPPSEPPDTDAPPSDEDSLPAWAAEGEALWDDEPEGPASGGPGEDAAGRGGPGAPAAREPAKPPPDPEDRMPEWAAEEPDEGAAADRVATETAEDEERRRERPAAPRPAHWEERARARQRRQRIIRIVGAAVLILAAITTTAFVLDLGPFERTVETAEAPVRPELPAELRGVTTEVATAAYGDVVERFREEWTGRELPERPPEEWLQGIYLSTAGDFSEVRSYWEGVREVVESFQARESGLFRERLEERLSERTEGAGGPSAAEAERAREAALFDFRATAPDRAEAYAGVLDAAETSLDLHALLVEREADIAYEPYSDPGVSRDPVLEAVPSDSILRAEMNGRLDRVLEAVEEGGLPRPITTATLGEHLLESLREAGVVAPGPPAPTEEGS